MLRTSRAHRRHAGQGRKLPATKAFARNDRQPPRQRRTVNGLSFGALDRAPDAATWVIVILSPLAVELLRAEVADENARQFAPGAQTCPQFEPSSAQLDD